jgi:DNA repair exonuclease SbcCD ATPase subunit
MLAAGCGNYKEKLQEAQQSIDRLVADNKKLTETVASLTKEKDRVTDALAAAETKGSTLERQLADLKKDQEELSRKSSVLERKQDLAQKEIVALKRDKKQLAEENERLKKQAAPSAAPEAGGPAAKEGAMVPRPGEAVTKPSKNLGPCDAVLEYMRKCGQVVRNNRGAQRTKLLEQLRKEYSAKMEGAPQKARTASAAWVKELAGSWDKPGDKTVFNLLVNRNEVLKACNKTPAEAGF